MKKQKRDYTHLYTYYGKPAQEKATFNLPVKKIGFILGAILLVFYLPFVVARKATKFNVKKESIPQ